MNFGERLRVEGISWNGHFDSNDNWVARKGFRELLAVVKGWSVAGGHAGDEYGNCTLYFRCPLFGIIWWYPTGHYQVEVEMPDPGVDRWVDKVYYDGCDEHCHHNDESPA